MMLLRRNWKGLTKSLFKQLQFLLILGCLTSDVYGGSTKLLIVLIDGFRWDYFPKPTDQKPSGLDAFISRGVKAEYMIPAFPSLSFPNYYTIMTGRTPEHHGFVNNQMYDTKYKTFYESGWGKDKTKRYWYDGGEPIWITAHNQGLHSEVYYLSICEGDLPGNKLVPCFVTQSHPNVTQIADTFLNVTAKFRENKTDMAVVYFWNIDHLGHVFGPNSPELKNEIAGLDGAILQLDNALHLQTYVDGRTKMSDLVNVIFVSDHGMSPLSATQFVNVTKFLNMEDIAVTTKGAVVYSIWPKEGKLEKVYNDLRNLPHARAYRKQDLPTRWHYRDHYHTPPITVVAEKGWLLLTPDIPTFPRNEENNNKTVAGAHGYDNTEPDVRAIFVAAGPYFKTHATIPPIESRDVYQVMCSVLGLHPANNDGNWTRVMGMFSNTKSTWSISTRDNSVTEVSFQTVVVTGGIGIISMVIVGAVAIILYLYRRRAHYRYRHVPDLDQVDGQFEL